MSSASGIFNKKIHLIRYGKIRFHIIKLIVLIIVIIMALAVLARFISEFEREQTVFSESPTVPSSYDESSRITPKDAIWQPVAGTRIKFYVFSAYVEWRFKLAIRIIAVTETNLSEQFVCAVTLPNNTAFNVIAKIKMIKEHWKLKYSAAFVMCALKIKEVSEAVGATVSIISEKNRYITPSNMLTVLDTRPMYNVDQNIHACVKPFHYAWNQDNWFIEWIEMNRLLGVNHFYMYNVTIGKNINCIIDYYKSLNVITMLQWKLPIRSQKDIRTEGQFAAFNDCLYRSMANAGWLLVIDMDELVIPHKGNSLHEFLRFIHPDEHPVGDLILRNAFFYMQWKDDPAAPNLLQVSRKTRRSLEPHEPQDRSKYMVIPQRAVELGNHEAWELVPGTNRVEVPKNVALLHHYRMVCEFGGVQCLTAPSIVDRTAHLWANELQRKVDSVKNILKKECRD